MSPQRKKAVSRKKKTKAQADKPAPGSSPAKKKPAKPASPRPDEMSTELIEFITAIDDYKRANERPFPSWSEVFEILKGLGYERSEP